MNATEIYVKSKRLWIQPHIIERAVRALGKDQYLEALALIRGAYADDEGAYAPLEEARTIFALTVEHSIE